MLTQTSLQRRLWTSVSCASQYLLESRHIWEPFPSSYIFPYNPISTLPCLVLPPSPSIYVSLSFSLGYCTLACIGNSAGPGWRRNPPPGVRTHQLGTRRELRDTTVYRLQRSSSLWSGGERSHRKAKAATGIPPPPPDSPGTLCLLPPFPSQDHLVFPASLSPVCLPPNLSSFPAVSETFWTDCVAPSACFLFPPPFSSLHLFSQPGGQGPPPHTHTTTPSMQRKVSPCYLPPLSSALK